MLNDNKAPFKIFEDDILRYMYLFVFAFQRKIRFDISCELSAWQMIHMKCQNLFSLKTIKKKNI